MEKQTLRQKRQRIPISRTCSSTSGVKSRKKRGGMGRVKGKGKGVEDCEGEGTMGGRL